MEQRYKPKRGFKGVWIPKPIWLSKELSIIEKVFLAEIDSLDEDDNGCYATNDYLAEFFGLSTKRVSFIINRLCSRGYARSEINKRAGNKRRLWVCPEKYPRPIAESGDTPIPENGDSPSPRKQGEARPESGDTPIPENEASDNKDNKIERKRDNKTDFSPVKLSPEKAYLLLRQYGISQKTANAIVFEQSVPPEMIEEVIKNGIAKQKFEPEFKLKSGYIIASINGARREGKIVRPTKYSKTLKKIIDEKNRPQKRLSPEEFQTKREKQKKLLTH